MYIKNSIVRLQPGIHILRHPKSGAPLTVSRAAGNPICNGELEVLSTAKTHGTILRDGSDCIVLLVKHAPVEMLVTAYLSFAEEAIPAIRVDMVALDSEVDVAAAPVAATKQTPFNISETGISLIGHIEKVGDVAVSDGALLGDPTKSLRLEGFQVMWPNKPAKVDINYQVSVEGAGELPSVNVGNFCGTRGEARRITEVTFSLVGADAAKYQLIGTAYFSGGFQIPISSGLALSGPSGFEHLSCLNLQVVAASKKTTSANAWLDSPKTKTFKATLDSKVSSRKSKTKA